MDRMLNMKTYKLFTILFVALVLLLGTFAYMQYQGGGVAGARSVVEQFGTALKNVPLSGSGEIARQAIQENYESYVTPELLEQWQADPSTAPGRQTSSPWPERIEIVSTAEQSESFVVQGNIVLMTSVEETQGGVAGLVPFVALVSPTDSGWRIVAFQEQTQEPQD